MREARTKELEGTDFFFKANDGLLILVSSRGLGDVCRRRPTDSGPHGATVGNPDVQIQGFFFLAEAATWRGPDTYTHLTLPTIYTVAISGVGVTLKKKNEVPIVLPSFDMSSAVTTYTPPSTSS